MSESKQGRTPTGYAGGEKYFVEKLVGKRVTAGKVEYRVKWWGWESKYNTWESYETMNEDCPTLVLEFEEDAKKPKRVAKLREGEHHGPAPPAEKDEQPQQPDSAEASGNDDGDDRGEAIQDSGDEDSGDEIKILLDIPAPKRQAAPLEEEPAKTSKAKTNGKSPAVPVARVQKKKVNKKRSSRKRRSRKTQVQADKPKHVAERILGATLGKNAELQFLIKWKDMPVANLVPASRANIGCPQLVISFYESRLVFREERMEVGESDLDDDDDEIEEAANDPEDGYHSDFDWKIVE